MSNPHEISLAVRDYECDLQGVVNNAVYMNYLEHARHEFLKDRGIDFAEVTRQGIHLVVVRAELDYRASLTSGDTFSVRTWFEMDGRLRYAFLQQIIRVSDGKVMLNGKITATSINESGRPFVPKGILVQLTGD
jgi:acyl-CoA thioester hydrolase